MDEDVKAILEDEEIMQETARKLCSIRGIDPDGLVGDFFPQWEISKGEIKRTLQVFQALGFAIDLLIKKQDQADSDAN